MLRDYVFPVLRVGRYEVRAYFEPRSFGVLIRWGRLSCGVCVIAHLGPFGAYVEPSDD
ncbi:hypothetical protein AB0J27_20215 [Micromonospora chokoriensis]